MLLLAQANAFQIPLPDKTVHCAGTSPPYYSLRKYAGEQEFIFGGDKDCVHEWGAELKSKSSDSYNKDFTERYYGHGAGQKKQEAMNYGELSNGNYCQHCNAWRGAYGLEPTLQMYVDHTVEWCREVWRVLRDDGTFWLNLGDSYAGSGGAGGDYNEGGLRAGQPKYPGTNSSTGFAKQNSLHKSGQENSRRAGKQLDLKPKDLMGVPWRCALALQADGWWLRSDIIWHKPNPMPESVTDRPTKTHEYLFLLTKKVKYFYDADAIRKPVKLISKERAMRGTSANNKYAPGVEKPPGVHANTMSQPREYRGYDDMEGAIARGETPLNPAGRNKRTVWTIATAPYKGAHFATFPPALVEPVIKAGTSEHGVCPDCGNPWERVTQKSGASHESKTDSQYKKNSNANRIALLRQAAREQGNEYDSVTLTLGWRPTCDHYDDDYRAFPRVRRTRKRYQQDVQDEWFKRARNRPLELPPSHSLYPIPAIVIDPFIGSGTTLIVARKLGRHGIGLDISMDYLGLANKRLGLKALQSWESGQGKDGGEGKDLSLLPLWSEKK